MSKKPKANDESIQTLTDDEGAEHQFRFLEFLEVGKKQFALLESVDNPKDGLVILKMKPGKGDEPTVFSTPTDKEFQAAADAFEAGNGCGCDCEHLEGECVEEPAPKTAPSAKKAPKAEAKKAPKAEAKKAPKAEAKKAPKTAAKKKAPR